MTIDPKAIETVAARIFTIAEVPTLDYAFALAADAIVTYHYYLADTGKKIVNINE